MKPLTSVGNLTMRGAVALFMKRFSVRLNLVLRLAAVTPLMTESRAEIFSQPPGGHHEIF